MLFEKTKKSVENTGQKLVLNNIQRVVIIIIFLIVIVPLFSINNLFRDYTAYQSGIDALQFMVQSNNGVISENYENEWRLYREVSSKRENFELINYNLIRRGGDRESNDYLQ